MPMLHFHVMTNDVGFLPDPDNVATHIPIDSAIDDLITRAEEWMDTAAVVMDEDPTTPTRGQAFLRNPHTYQDEVGDIDEQIKEIQGSLSTDETFTEQVAHKGLLITLEDGIAVIELTPCSEEACETYRKDWIE